MLAPGRVFPPAGSLVRSQPKASTAAVIKVVWFRKGQMFHIQHPCLVSYSSIIIKGCVGYGGDRQNMTLTDKDWENHREFARAFGSMEESLSPEATVIAAQVWEEYMENVHP